MIDDTRDFVEATYSSSVSAEVLEIAKYRISRHLALVWSQNLHFLAFDDSHEEARK